MQVHRDGHDQPAVPHRSAWRDGFERTVPAWATRRRVQVSVLCLPRHLLHSDDQCCRDSVVAVDQANRHHQ
jgi:hypothetical protein